MGNCPSSTKTIPTEQIAQAGLISASQNHAALSLMTVLDRITALGNALRRRRPAAAPTLQFDDAAPRTEEPDLWPSFHDDGSSAIEHAQLLEDLQDAAAKRLDAALYALCRLRLDLAAVAPELVDSLPGRLAHELDTPALAAPVAIAKPDAGPKRHDIAA